jgi:fructose-bisphosphate aldolase, class I
MRRLPSVAARNGADGSPQGVSKMADIARIAAKLVSSGRGILAADESVSTMNARLLAAGVPATRENRLAYREMLVTTPFLAEGVSGVIVCDETFRQRLAGGEPFPDALAARGMLAGIKVDCGAKPLAGVSGETVTEGLDGLRGRLAEYACRGARFATWRAVFRIGGQAPTWRAMRANAHALTRYAALCQEAGLVPVVEPEVLAYGTHGAERCSAATAAVLFSVIAELQDFEVDLAAVVLTPNMVLPGASSGDTLPPDAVAARTIRTFHGLVPAELAGIAFLCGGQDPGAATANLAALRRTSAPWPLTFAFGRALAQPALAAWQGDPRRVSDGQRALANRVACNLAALRGGYRAEDAGAYALA